MSEPTQNDFNKSHNQPIEYGEGDYYIVSPEYSEDKAAKIINDWEENLTGERPKYTADDICDFGLAWRKGGDDNEWGYCIVRDDTAEYHGIGVAL